MTRDTLKIVIPMAGLGTRLRPHTRRKPKQLIQIAGRAMLSHVLAMFESLPPSFEVEYVFIIGHLGEQIPPFMAQHYPDASVHYVEQQEMLGQSHAIALARAHLQGPMLMVFADTLVETDFSFLAAEKMDSVAWVKRHPDPRRFGVAIADGRGRVRRLVEKPEDTANDLVIVGFYYFRRAEALLAAIEKQMARDVQLKGEYYLADAVNILLEEGLRMRVQPVEVWLDAGTPEAVLQTNRYLLSKQANQRAPDPLPEGVAVIPPVYIHPQAHLSASVIGPYAAVGANCQVERSVLTDTILEDGASVKDVVLQTTLLGEGARVEGRASIINAIGDEKNIRG